jgi:predicted HAD superfamily phosphohydrolase YqeG
MTSILVNPISKKDRKVTWINRFIEKIIMFVLNKRDLFKKGKYYE